MLKTCKKCGVEFEAHHWNCWYCSPACGPNQPFVITKTCIVCGKQFESSGRGCMKRVACSERCKAAVTAAIEKNRQAKRKASRQPILKMCCVCGKKFAARAAHKTCSPECSIKNEKEIGKLYSERYWQTERYKQNQDRWRRSEKCRKYQREWRASENGKACSKRFRQSETYKQYLARTHDKKNEWLREYERRHRRQSLALQLHSLNNELKGQLQ